ncbi:MAG: prohibitin family protein [Candidatus Cloacimonetes bacterium]|nr:prohibitin family protein [Candidatus Cloacimonadota bacterium]
MSFLLFFVISVVALLVFIFAKLPKAKKVGLTVFVIFLLFALKETITIVPAGHVGVVDVFGKVQDKELKAGLNFRNPLAKVILFSVKTQEVKEVMNVPSQEGLIVGLEISILYRLDSQKASEIYNNVGINYPEVVLIPHFRSVSRTVTSSFEAKALYTSERELLIQTIQQKLEEIVNQRGIVIESTPLRSIVLPSRLTQAIEQKLEAEQESQRMEFILLKEQKEAERKRIEAQGIADFQLIVTKGISKELLKWKGIEATEKLASSANTKIVVIGGEDGLPIIMNADAK